MSHANAVMAHLQRLGRRLRANMPTRETLVASPMLRPVARHLLAPALWRTQHESVARGVAVGVFWAFVIPFAQILFAAAHCVWWRANIPVAAAVTFVTNPFTLGFWLWLAYGLGSTVVDAPPPVMPGEGASVWDWLLSVGWPAVIGMGMFAVGGALGSYLLIKLGWRLRIAWKRRGRR